MNLNPFKKKQPVKIEVVFRDPCRLSLKEWRSQPHLIKQANTFLNDYSFRTMVDVLEREHPAGVVLDDRVTFEQRAVWQARCEGYTMAIANLFSMGQLEQEREQLEATFEPPEMETDIQ